MKPDHLRERTLVPILVSILLFILVASVVQGWAGSSKKADLSSLVVVGDSLSAGFQNGSLLATQQVNGFASLIAAQAGVELALPLIAAPGIPNVLTLVDLGPPPTIGQEPGVSPGRSNPTVQPLNLAVPGAKVQDALTARPDLPINSLTDLVLGFPGLLPEILFGIPGTSLSQVEWAEVLGPTTILVWIGNNDILDPALFGATAEGITPLDQFMTDYGEVIDRLAATGAKLVVANLPDVTAVPFLISAETFVAQVAAITGVPAPLLQALLGIGPGDLVTPEAFGFVPAALGGSPLPIHVVLTAEEVGMIRVATAEYNAFIAAKAAENGAALVDIHALLETARTRGIVVGGQRLSTAFLGGLFSLDGVHPTNTGYAVLANEFIKALNTHFAAGIPPVPVRQVQKTDPLVLPGVGHPASALGHVTPEAVASLRAALGRRQ